MQKMTIDMKLKHFEEVCLGDARASYNQAVSDYTASQEALFKEYKEKAEKQAAARIDAEKEVIRRDMNKKLSVHQIASRRAINKKSEELKGMLFSELRDRLARFMESREYMTLLQNQIRHAKEVADGAPMHVYIDPSDQDKRMMLSLKTGCDIRVSRESFLGGTRAVINSKNILIDSSFQSRLKEAEEDFQFILGGTQHGSSR